mgnify:CR=1 FL=1
MSKATAVLKPGEPVTLPPAGNISFEIETGQRFKLTQPEGEQVADARDGDGDGAHDQRGVRGADGGGVGGRRR